MAKNGDRDAQAMLGVILYNTKNCREAVYWFQKAADQGQTGAYYYLGECYRTGCGFAQNYQQAAVWYRKAAERDHAHGQISLSECYTQGRGVPQNNTQALYWMKRAANKGSADGQVGLATMYERGTGVPINKNLALHWYEKALSNEKDPELSKESIKRKIEGYESEGYTSLRDNINSNPTPQVTALWQGRWRSLLRAVMNSHAYKGQVIDKGNTHIRNGLGIIHWKREDDFHVGKWANNIQNGMGIHLAAPNLQISNCAKCCYYVGNWREGVKSGEGSCYDKNGNLLYTGKFANNKPIEKYPNTKAISSYKFECKEYKDGSKYLGETKNGRCHGIGFLINTDGSIWYGNWKDGRRNGNGIEIPYTGQSVTGRWAGNTYYNY
ncbi:hypothetical protein FACS189411_08790 [Bacteroidia bacterium]|nr:hypothetical protein FACS189411_08790 [Bacteroidia bacterium]